MLTSIRLIGSQRNVFLCMSRRLEWSGRCFESGSVGDHSTCKSNLQVKESVKLVHSENAEVSLTNSPLVRWSDRSISCGHLRAEHVGASVSLSGWVQYMRMDKFLILRDASGTVQITSDDTDNCDLTNIPLESVVRVTGQVRLRPADQANPAMATGQVEVLVKSPVQVLSKALASVPLHTKDKGGQVTEVTANRYRYLYLRSPEVQSHLRTRSQIVASMRHFLLGHGFVDVETPTLFRRTPGGAQEFVVPTRDPGRFYSLVQSPQQFKQLLMAGGLDRYFQIARCYRDEGGKPDRQPEFTQVDIELSFTSREQVMSLTEDLIRSSWPSPEQGSVGLLPEEPFPILSHKEAMSFYGTDKPDLRYPETIIDVSYLLCNVPVIKEILQKEASSVFRGIALVPDVTCQPLSSSKLKKVEQGIRGVLQEEMPAMFTPLSVNEKGELRCSILKKCPDDIVTDVVRAMNLSVGSSGFLACGSVAKVSHALGRARSLLADHLKKLSGAAPLWVQEFPLFETDNNGRLQTVHHPFTRPRTEDENLLATDPLCVFGEHYDLVLNGSEIAGGSIRIHELDLQLKVLNLLQLDQQEFGPLLEALQYGCPPHGGVAIGLDRMLSVALGTKSIRDVMAFPKSREGRDTMSGAPALISKEEQTLYHIKVTDL